jgi:hypothetical protein
MYYVIDPALLSITSLDNKEKLEKYLIEDPNNIKSVQVIEGKKLDVSLKIDIK